MSNDVPALIEIDDNLPARVFSNESEMDKLIAAVREKVDVLSPDVNTAKGRDEIRSMAYKVARTKTALDEAGKKLTEDKRAEIALVDKERKRMRDQLDAMKDKVRAPLTAYEEAEEKRKAAIVERLDKIKQLGAVPFGATIEDIESRREELAAIDPGDGFDDLADQAVARHEAATNLLNRALQEAQERAERERELAEMRKAQEEREARDRAAREAEERKRREEDAARLKAAEEAEAKLAQERAAREAAEREQLAAEQRARDAEERAERAAAAERERIEREAETKREEEARAKKLKAERQRLIKEAVEDLSRETELSDDVCTEILKAIATKKVRHVSFGGGA